MWNNNGNNGQGNGYGQQQQYGGYGQQDVYGRLDSTRSPGGARFPFIEDGRHKLALCTLEEFQHASDGPSARALFEVLESSKHAPGSYVVKIWKLVKPPKFQNANSLSDGELFTDFCRKLKGAPDGYVMSNDIRVLMKDRAGEQLARGTVIECVGVLNKKGNWTNIYWNAVQQTPADIAAVRQRLEQKGIPDTSARPAPGGGQFQGAPHPAQNPQAYPAQQQGYGVPQQPQYGGHQQQPMPAGAPQGQLGGVPPQQPAPAPQGWGQPAPQQPATFSPQGAPQGWGQNNGNNGGQGTW